MTTSEWRAVDDGEYNEQLATTMVGDVAVVVAIYSDRDGERWSCVLPTETEPFDLEATDVDQARAEAIREAHAR
jgi:hypothetical protein